MCGVSAKRKIEKNVRCTHWYMEILLCAVLAMELQLKLDLFVDISFRISQFSFGYSTQYMYSTLTLNGFAGVYHLSVCACNKNCITHHSRV